MEVRNSSETSLTNQNSIRCNIPGGLTCKDNNFCVTNNIFTVSFKWMCHRNLTHLRIFVFFSFSVILDCSRWLLLCKNSLQPCSSETTQYVTVRSLRLCIYLTHYVNLLVFGKVLALICSYLESFRRNVLSSIFGRFHCSINISKTKLVWSGFSAYTREFRKEFFPTWVRIDSV